jgi:diadenylate cyclase
MPVRVQDILDILLVALLLYQGYRLVVGTRAFNVLRGLLVFGLAWFVAGRLELRTISFVLSQVATVGLFALVVIFQPELRAFLERLGRGRSREPTPMLAVIGEVVRAVERLAERKVGALIAFERATPLGEHARTGVSLDGAVSAPTLETIFARNTPLHDGGLIVAHGRIVAANCLFPLQNLSDGVYRRYGTRHRAALGISELSDALIIVVSEERGVVRVAENGQLSPDLTVSELRERLRTGLVEPEQRWFDASGWWPRQGNKDSKADKAKQAKAGNTASADATQPSTRRELRPQEVEGATD